MPASPWLEALDETIGHCLTLERTDLAERLRQRRDRLVDPALRVVVIGEPNHGKSQLVNALVNAPVCAVGDGVTTIAPTVLRHSEVPSAALVTEDGGTRGRVPVPVERVGAEVGQRVGSAGRRPPVAAEVGIPRSLLAAGLVLVDTPALRPRPAEVTAATVADADAVLLVSAATAELSATELAALAAAGRSCPNIVVALTKTDIAPRWRAVAQRCTEQLAAAELPATVLPVSTTLRLHAGQTGDKQLNAESGFGELVSLLRRQVQAKSRLLAPRTVAVSAGGAVAELVTGLREQLAEDADASGADGPSAAREVQLRLEALRRASSRCQTVLADEMTDLMADTEYDLRDRARRILREVDRAFDEADPSTAWEAFAEWLEQTLAEAAEANLSWLLQRCEWIAEKVASQYPAQPAVAGHGALAPAADDPAMQVDLDAGEVEPPRLDRFSVGQKVFTGVRGSYGGVLMVGLITALAGMPLINAISIGAGVAFGSKSVIDEAETRRRRRQAAAKAAAQRHVDDFFLRFGKETKHLARTVQRQLRDHFTARTHEMIERLNQTATDARQAAHSEATMREARNRDLLQELARLTALYDRLRALPRAGTVAAQPIEAAR